MNDHIFSLDIGTRSVTGIILEKRDEKFTVIDFCIKEHKERSMLDGQIHNVVAVSDVIKDVKETLEQRNGELNEACVAAAGRSLKTTQATATLELNEQPITNKETIKHLELSAVQTAQLKLTKQKENYTNYYCVGYSILHYTLDGDQIGSLIDQNGDKATVEVIATFLPNIVVESLFSALDRANLVMKALTLEPIAAINVLIPESMRRLNVALVDIGAGTSDIAITNKGTIVAYGMVPMAGDEITEAISDHYLLDFPEAEETKINIVKNGQANVHDILGYETTITYDSLVDKISENVNTLSESLAEEIIRLNKKSPKAVMLIGGGSLTPTITTVLAQKLQLSDNRIAVRGIEAIQTLNKNDLLPSGPDFVTPIGIAISAKQDPVYYLNVKVNEQSVRMFEVTQLTVGDCLVQANIEINKLYGKPGLASIISINGEDITLPGKFGTPPIIQLNNKNTNVETQIRHEDKISIQKGSNGENASVTIKELLGDIPSSIAININDKQYELESILRVNNKVKNEAYIIQDKDRIVLKTNHTIHDFLTNFSMNTLNIKPFFVYVNSQKVYIDKAQSQFFVNNKHVNQEYILDADDHLKILEAQDPLVRDLLQQLNKRYWNTIEITFNEKPITMRQSQLNITINKQNLNEDDMLKLSDHIEIKDKSLKTFIFQDVFRYVDLDLSNVKGNFQIYKNNEQTTFYESIQQGDQLEIKWD